MPVLTFMQENNVCPWKFQETDVVYGKNFPEIPTEYFIFPKQAYSAKQNWVRSYSDIFN